MRLAALLIALIALLQLPTTAAAEPTALTSPDGRIAVEVELVDGQPTYTVACDGKPLVERSMLGVTVQGAGDEAWREIGRTDRQHDACWEPVWGKRRTVRDHYNERIVKLERLDAVLGQLDVIVRVHDDGVAIRYVLQPRTTKGAEIVVTGDRTGFSLAGQYTVWSHAGEHDPRGPESLEDCSGRRRLPMVMAPEEEGPVVALGEAALENFAWLEVDAEKGTNRLKAVVGASRVTTGFSTPWRVIFVVDQPGRLLDSDLIANLNPPAMIEDVSWIRPGVSFWDWRAAGHQVDGFTYGLDMESWKRFVDLAHEKKIPYLLLDANWYGDEWSPDSDPLTAKAQADIPGLIRYARERNVGVILYLNDLAFRRYSLEEALKAYADWGAAGVKYGFMRGTGQAKVNKTRRIIRVCAENRLLCDFHDSPVPPTGDERTWPNCVTREFCHSQSDAKRVFGPNGFVTQIYVNTLGGPIDMCNGMFDMNRSFAERPKIFQEVPSTIIAEAARTLLVHSGMTVLADSADSYRKHAELFEFIAAEQMPWDESRTLSGKIGESITMMRRAGDTVLIASATNDQARTIRIPLDFLPPGEHEAILYEDSPHAHYRTNREAYRVRRLTVTSEDVIEARLAPGGGHCMLIR